MTTTEENLIHLFNFAINVPKSQSVFKYRNTDQVELEFQKEMQLIPEEAVNALKSKANSYGIKVDIKNNEEEIELNKEEDLHFSYLPLWAESSRSIISYLRKFPRNSLEGNNFLPHLLQNIDQLISNGTELKKWILALRNSEKLFETLFENYEKSFKKVLEEMKKLIWNPTKREENSLKFFNSLMKNEGGLDKSVLSNKEYFLYEQIPPDPQVISKDIWNIPTPQNGKFLVQSSPLPKVVSSFHQIDSHKHFFPPRHTSNINCSLILPNGLLVTGSDDSLRFWNLDSGENVSFYSNLGKSKCLILMDNLTFVSSSSGMQKKLYIWDSNSLSLVKSLENGFIFIFFIFLILRLKIIFF